MPKVKQWKQVHLKKKKKKEQIISIHFLDPQPYQPSPSQIWTLSTYQFVSSIEIRVQHIEV